MKKSAEQWVIVNGRVFRLERVVDDVYTALLLQRTLRSTCEIHLERIEDGRWAVYWRSKQAIECTPQLKGTPTH